RLSPRWRFLLWGVVLTRFLVVATPASPWSAFNLVPHATPAASPVLAELKTDAANSPVPQRSDSTTGADETSVAPPRPDDARPDSAEVPATVPAVSPAPAAPIGTKSPRSLMSRLDAVVVTRILSAFWLAGTLCLALKLLATALVLRRR